jgi:hypothetical protein
MGDSRHIHTGRDASLFRRAGDRGGAGVFQYDRELVPIDQQTVIRSNRDMLYLTGVFDLDASPARVTCRKRRVGSCR